MKNKTNFIVTKDEETANKLIAFGLRLVTNVGGVYTFENKLPEVMNFSDIDRKKIAYTNIITI